MSSEVRDILLSIVLCSLTLVTEMFGLQGPEAYAYTSVSNCLEVQGINDTEDYAETLVCASFTR
jgi:myosin heavy subunit